MYKLEGFQLKIDVFHEQAASLINAGYRIIYIAPYMHDALTAQRAVYAILGKKGGVEGLRLYADGWIGGHGLSRAGRFGCFTTKRSVLLGNGRGLTVDAIFFDGVDDERVSESVLPCVLNSSLPNPVRSRVRAA